MNFEHSEYLPFIILALLFLVISLVWLERKFFRMVKTYWFFDRSIFSYVSSVLFCLGMGTLLFSLVDIRGPEEKIKMEAPVERTIILLDTSASMLAEDVKPSRLEKAVLVAKHFARKAVGHQLAIVAFAEIQKKIVPFTSDLDLIDARLDSLKNLRNQNGSSALSLAIQESVQYFKETGEARGNILVLTDGEETAEGINLKLPKEVHLALVGIGTTRGGRIPLDDGRGFRFGYKKNRGKDVITKLNENFFKNAIADVPSGKYWLANTYTLPSEEILSFFNSEKVKGQNQQDMVIKPVMMEWIVIPGLFLLVCSYFFKALRIFTLGMFFIVLPLKAQEREIELSPEIHDQLEELQKGELTQLEKLKLADQLQKAGAKEEAISLYEENLPMDRSMEELPPEAYLNYGTALLEKGEEQKGLAVYDSLAATLDQESEQGKQIKEMIQKNVVNFFQEQEKKKEQQKKDQEKDQSQDQNNQNQNNQNQDNQNQNNQNQNNQNQSNQSQNNQDQKNENTENKDKDKKDQKNSSDKDENQDKDNKSQDNESGDKDKKKLPPPKVTPKLKQLMSDDRQLQMKMIEQGTRDLNKRKSRENKDW